MTKNNIRIKLKGYDHRLVDQSIKKIIESLATVGAAVKGPIPLPTERNIITVLRATHKYKDSREQFEMRTHKRIIEIVNADPKIVDMLMRVQLPSGIGIEVKV